MTQDRTGEPRIRVALADDHPVVLAGVKALLQAAPGIDLVGEANDGEAALRLIADAAPDIAVLDIAMPGIDGLSLARRVSAERPGVRVIALTVHEDPTYVQQLMEAGARGYVLKRSAAEELLRAVRAVAGGGTYLDPAVAGKALARGGPEVPAAGEALSPREGEVLRLIAQGFSNKEIALRLDVSVKTVETHKARAASKLGLRSRAEIVRYGAAQGWLRGLAEAP